MKDQYLIDADDPLHDLDTPSAKAFAVRDRNDQDAHLFALICTPGLPTRMSLMYQLRLDDTPGSLPLLEWGTVFWPPINQETMVVIYRRPLGGNVANVIDAGDFKINEYEVQETFIEPMYRTIKSFSNRGIFHREIRVDNLYFMDQERLEVVLGDCVTCPPGFDQPGVYESLERNMSSQAGRGIGNSADELYALAVTVVALVVGREKIEKIDADEVIYSKIENGSYTALVGKQKMVNVLMEPLRGMLTDNPGERWDFPEVDLWLDGKRQTPMQRKFSNKIENPFLFMDREFRNPRSLAHAFSKNIGKAAIAIKEDELDLWLRRTTDEGELADQIKSTVDLARTHSGNFRGSDPYLVARACIQLDPAAPVRYKDVAFIPESIGAVLAVELLRKGNMDAVTQALNYALPEIWFKMTSEITRDPASLDHESTFGRIRTYLQNRSIGFGAERCLYELNTSLPCLSPLVKDQYVTEIVDLLPALDDIADSVDNKLDPFDDHVVAFIAARFKEHIEPHLQALSEEKRASQLIGMLSLMAFMQWKLKIESLFALSSWIGGLLGPTVKTYYSRTTRGDIEGEMPQIVRKGSMPELFNLIDNADKRAIDANGYVVARNDYALAEEQILEIQETDLSSKEKTLEIGQRYGAITSVILALLFVSITFIVDSFNG
ncbi:MAG TPA: hypothetical protein ENI69_08330 [Rhodospirillales bacterium]|nr:hypothetical protein [Rhodospirillales bacterium]